MILHRNDEDDNIDLLLSRKQRRCLDTVAVESRRVDKRDVHDAIVQEGLIKRSRVAEIKLENRPGPLLIVHDVVQIAEIGALVR